MTECDADTFACESRCENPGCALDCIESRGPDFARQEKIVLGWPDLPIKTSWGAHVGVSGSASVGYTLKLPDPFHPNFASDAPGTKTYLFAPVEDVPKHCVPRVEVSFIAPALIDAEVEETKAGKRVVSKAPWRSGEQTVVAYADERDISVSTFTKFDATKALRCNAFVVDAGVVAMHRDKIEPWLIKLCTPTDVY